LKNNVVLLIIAMFLVGCDFMSSNFFNTTPEATPEPVEIYTEFRNRVFSTDPNEIGISQSEETPHVWGILMETAWPDAVVTLVSLADGTTSVYFSSAAVVIGGGEHATVAEASQSFIATAEQYYQQMSPTESFPLPTDGKVRFYVLTFSGVFTLEVDESELENRKHRLSPLFYSGHEVITQVRIIDEQKK
jgi:hypothetical protein